MVKRLSQSDVYTSSTAPTNVATGKLWYDTGDTTPLGNGNSALSLGDSMRPMSQAMYPASDIVSYTVSGTAPSFVSQHAVIFNDADANLRFRYTPSTFYNAAGNGVNAINGMTTSSSFGWTGFEVEFLLNGDRFSILSVNIDPYADYRIFVDDMPIDQNWGLLSSSAIASNYITVQFATSRTRKVRVFLGGDASFTAVYLPGASDIWAPPPRYRVAITGDSYIHGGQGSSEGPIAAGAVPNELAILTGWEVLNLGQAGTGYVNNGSNANGRDYYGASSRLAALAALPAIDLFISFGGGNDSYAATPSATATAANTFWDAVKAARPTTPIVVVGVEPGSLAGFNNTDMDAINNALKSAAASNINVAGFIDMRTTPWVVGTGYMTAPAYNGNADFHISSDAVHPSHSGCRNIASRMVDELRKVKV